jgi:hypothetical protein
MYNEVVFYSIFRLLYIVLSPAWEYIFPSYENVSNSV